MTRPVAHAPSSTSPVSVADHRWLPTRAGLVNVWQYTEEVFELERGRLVLYGPNGSGKTMALELLLPHLLDARSWPGRLSTSGRDRGGLWDRVSGYDEGEARTGYLWVEFAMDEERAFTAGVRLRAKPSGGGEKHWFSTSRRIGIDFSLLGDKRHPLSVEQLKEAIGSEGKLWGADTGGYRQAVRTTLFPGWSDDRLDALLRTLLVVRKQNVTDGLSPGRLSELLSEALPPLDELELGKVADGFADLDRRRDHITELEKDVAETRRLAHTNRLYARSVTARIVGEVVKATTAFDNVTREVRRLSEELTRCTARVSELNRREEALETEYRTLAGRLDGLKSSEAYKHGAELENLQRAAADAKQRAQDADREATGARKRAEKRRRNADEAQEKQAIAERQMRRARQELEATAASLGAGMLEEIAAEALGNAAIVWIDERRGAIQEVREQLQCLELAISRRNDASEHQMKCEERLTVAEESLYEATQAAKAALTRWREAIVSWRSNARELGPYLEPLDEPETVSTIVSEAWNRAREPLTEHRLQIEQKITSLDDLLEELRDELEAWLAGREAEPDIPTGRRDRTGLSGAPLWRLVQFQEHVSDTVRGNIESALAHSRLLDAWIAPDGRISIEEGESDLQLMVDLDAETAWTNTQTLASLLEPDPAADALDREAIDAILTSLAVVERDAHLALPPARGVLIGLDGSWQTPRLAGRAPVGPARYIGLSSRENARRARVEAIGEEIEGHESVRRSLQSEHDEIMERIQRCEHEKRSFPPILEIQNADQDEERKRIQMESAKEVLVQANETLLAANEEVKAHQRTLHTMAMGRSLPTDTAGLAEFEERLTKVRNDVFVFQQRYDRAVSAESEAGLAEDLSAEAKLEANRHTAAARARHDESEEAASRLAAVEEAVGSEYREVLDEIGAVQERQAQIQREQRSLRTEHSEAVEAKGSVTASVAQAEEKRAAADEQRTRAGETFVALCRDGLIEDAAIADSPKLESLTSTTAILEAARRIRSSEKLPPAPADSDLTRMLNKVSDRANATSRQLAGRADLTFEVGEHFWSVLRARREGMVASSLTLLVGFREDLDAAKSELSRKQQELFEQILSGDVREHLKGRLWAAQALVERINELLRGVRTESGGVMVGLRWEINPDLAEAAELREAKELLLRDSPVDQGRSKLDAFLKGRIEQVRAADDDTGEWRDRLARMLDYRSWHRFRVLVHHDRFGERPRALDSRKVSLSAGEKTMVMVLPLIAAVTAHYEPAPGEPPCVSPRLLLMDELFPKLDFPNKRKLMGLFPKLHLDAVFTSDKDRCEYDTLDGIAIHVCQKLSNDKTTTTRLVWNGIETFVPTEDPGGESNPDGSGRITRLTSARG